MNAAQGSHSSQWSNDSSEDLFSDDEDDFIDTLAKSDAVKSEDQTTENQAWFQATQPLFDSFSSERNASNSNSEDEQCVAQTFKAHPDSADRERAISARKPTNHDERLSSLECRHSDFQNSNESQLPNDRLVSSSTTMGTTLETNDERLIESGGRKRPLTDCSVVSGASLFSGDENSDCERDDSVDSRIYVDVEPRIGPTDALLSVEHDSAEGAASSHLMDPKKQKTSEMKVRTKRKNRRHIPLTDMRWGFVSVTDLVAQSWCEQKLVYSYFPPTPEYEMVPLEEIAPAVAAGQQIHQERDMELGDKIVVETETKEDHVALQLAQLLECMRAFIFGESGVILRREIPILGFLPLKLPNSFSSSSRSLLGDVLVNGVVDELRFDVDSHSLTLVELKTRYSNNLPCQAQKRGHRLQVMLYRSFYNDLVEGRVSKSKLALHRKLNLARDLSPSVVEALWCTVGDGVFSFRSSSGIGPSIDIASPSITLGEVLETLLNTAKAAPRIDRLHLEYIYQKSKQLIAVEDVHFDPGWLVNRSIDAAEFWFGLRGEPKGVDIEDAWKCGMCEFSQDCQWRISKVAELQTSAAVDVGDILENITHKN